MFEKIMLLLLLEHILGDFYFQTVEVSEKKKNKFRWTLVHGLIYFLVVLVVSVPFISFYVLLLDFFVAISHVIIDIFKYFCVRRKGDSSKVFLIDQGLHLLCLIIIAYVYIKNNLQLQEHIVMSTFFDTIGISEIMVCKWVLGLLIIHKPANILIQQLTHNYKPKIKVDNTIIKVDNNIGRVIGSVERVIMFILIYLNQYSAIGLVLTAKSIARYDKIVREKDFAEYYLLGTLISVGIVIVCAMALFGG